jgi:hypothetical protein
LPAEATVVVYSTDPADSSRVSRAFIDFSRTLPPAVRVVDNAPSGK